MEPTEPPSGPTPPPERVPGAPPPGAQPPPGAPPPPLPGEPGTPGMPAVSRRFPVAGLVVGIVISVLVAGGLGLVLRSSRNKDEAQPKSPQPVASLEPGWTAYQETGFSIGLPPEWKSVPTTSADEAFNSLKADNPQLAAIARSQLSGSLSGLVKFLALDVNSPTLKEQFATNLNVVVVTVPSDVSLADYIDESVRQLKSLGDVVSDIQQSRVRLPAGPAGLVRSHLTVTAPDGSKVAAVTQYLLLRDGTGIVLSLTTTPAHAGSYADPFEKIAGTFRFR